MKTHCVLIIVSLLVGIGFVGGCKKSADIGETVQGPRHVGATGPSVGPGEAGKKVPSQP